MNMLVKGKLSSDWLEQKIDNGKLKHVESSFRNWITDDGCPGPTGNGGFKAEPNRYHLYVSPACPWAHRIIIMRKLKNLESIISISEVTPEMLEHGWQFASSGKHIDHLFHANYMHEIYTRADSDYSGQITVPVLWDKKNKTIVNNESSEIMRMLNTAFNQCTDVETDYYPESNRQQIDTINDLVFENINIGVYRCGFATTQGAYEEALYPLFETLDLLDHKLSSSRYLVRDTITEADWRLFTTLIRFDAVYTSLFKCNLRPITSYHNLSNYLRDLYQQPGISDTVDMEYIKQHYYYSLTKLNPSQIVPVGPAMNYELPHNRALKFSNTY